MRKLCGSEIGFVFHAPMTSLNPVLTATFRLSRCASLSVSYADTLTADFVHEGVLDDHASRRCFERLARSGPYLEYLPELRGSGWEDATLRQVMDIRKV